MKTQRVTLLVSPADKRRFKQLADRHGLSVSGLVREAVNVYDVSSIGETQQLSALTAELRDSVPAMRRRLREATASVDRALSTIAARRAKR
ncbi:MAG TPA: hypothetical protein VFB32_06050 [Rudaea sp.]|nr:hypothetical protein [Rudaea sp.]